APTEPPCFLEGKMRIWPWCTWKCSGTTIPETRTQTGTFLNVRRAQGIAARQPVTTGSGFLAGLPLSRGRGRCKGAEARRGAFSPRLARIRCAALGPREQGGQRVALAFLALDELGQRQGLAVEPAPLDLAGFAVDCFPDERGGRLVTLDGLVGERLGLAAARF